jgi:murein DD-endopeptidase MepM/ murein hydrolase activator NlpD
MLFSVRLSNVPRDPAPRARVVFVFPALLALGACSADVTRLDAPNFGLTTKPEASAPPRPTETIGRRSAMGAPTASDQSAGGWPSSGPRDSDQAAVLRPAAPAPADSGVRVAGLPAASSDTARAPARPIPVKEAPRAAAPAATGETIEVQQGDSLYALSKRHNVPISALMEANGLKNPNLKPGQKLVLPARSGRRVPATRVAAPTPAAAPSPAVPASSPAVPPVAVAAPSAPASSDASWDGSYTLKPGDSLYAVARQHRVTLAELQRQNNIADPTKVRAGTALKIPGSAAPTPSVPGAPAVAKVQPSAQPATPSARPSVAPSAPPSNPAAPPRVVATTPAVLPSGGSAPVTPKIISGPVVTPDDAATRVTARTDSANDASATSPAVPPVVAAPPAASPAKAERTAAAPASGPKFRWPAKGKVVSEFGPRADGSHNDGINVAVPVGTEVHAADGGSVVYAGNELKGYGNLVLIRHDNGFVTAYAHNDQILVKRGDAVRRGQVIAKSGKSGSAEQPVVHFELRNGSKPVDPMPYMERL